MAESQTLRNLKIMATKKLIFSSRIDKMRELVFVPRVRTLNDCSVEPNGVYLLCRNPFESEAQICGVNFVVLNEVLTYNYMGMLESALFFTSR